MSGSSLLIYFLCMGCTFLELGARSFRYFFFVIISLLICAEHEIIPGRAIPSECHAEVHTDYSGEAVRWGLTHHVNSAADCCQACLDQAKNATEEQKKCNIWVYCPSEGGCHSPDKYLHKNHECWLKQVSSRCFHVLPVLYDAG